jgi:hypothetical protein
MNVLYALLKPLLTSFLVFLLCVLSFHSIAITLTETEKLTGSDNDLGLTVSIDDDTIVVRGKVEFGYTFTRTDGVWTEQGILKPTHEFKGYSHSLGGDTYVVGDPTWDVNSAYVFARDNGIWPEQAELKPSGYVDPYGWSVSVDGDTAVVGGILDDAPGEDGSAYVFVRENGNWTEKIVLKPSGYKGQVHFGESVAIDGGTILVGGGGDWNEGKISQIYVFTHTEGTWVEETRLTPSDNDPELRYGLFVHLDSDTALIGVPASFRRGTVGKAYVFRRNSDIWSEEAILAPRDPETGDILFLSYSLSDNNIIVQALEYYDGKEKHRRTALVFKRINGVWSEIATLTASDQEANDFFAASVSVSSNTAVVGARIEDEDNESIYGAVYVFTIPAVIVSTDIKPSKRPENVINLKKGKNLKVAIVGTADFDALQVDPSTVKFGPSEASPIRYKGKDYNKDGFSDLILTFMRDETGIACGDTEATLTGQTFPDPVINIAGSDTFTVEPCP